MSTSFDAICFHARTVCNEQNAFYRSKENRDKASLYFDTHFHSYANQYSGTRNLRRYARDAIRRLYGFSKVGLQIGKR